MLSAAIFYIVSCVIASIIYAIYLMSDKKIPTSTIIYATLCSIVCALVVSGILFLIQKSYPTAAWIIVCTLLFVHLLSLIFSKPIITTNTKSEN